MDQITTEEKDATEPSLDYELIIRHVPTGHAVGAASEHLYDFLKPLRPPFKEQNPGVKTQLHLMFRIFRQEVMNIQSDRLGPESEQQQPTEQGSTEDAGPKDQSSDLQSSGDSGPEPVPSE